MRTRDRIVLSVSIQHTPARADDWVFHQLCKDLDSYYPYTIIEDERLPLPNENRTWGTYRRCLEKTSTMTTHKLILQDDVALCENFIPAVKQAIQAHPDRLLSFFLSNKPSTSAINYFQACDKGSVWAPLDNKTWVPAQALVWPRFMVGPMLRYAEKAYRVNRPDDELIGEWLGRTDQVALCTIPCLVEHAHHTGRSSNGALGGQYRSAICHVGGYDPLRHCVWG